MKVAICISGHLRNWRQNKSSQNFIQYIQSIADTDVFVATWNRENATKSWSEMHGLSNLERCKNIIHPDEVAEFYQTDKVFVFDEEFYISDYSPLRYSALTKEIFNWNPHGQQNGVLHSTKMYFLIYMANLLKQENEFRNKEKYDLVFRIRPDFEFYENKYKEFDFQNLSEDILCIGENNTREGRQSINFCDKFAFGSSNIIDIYSSTYLKVGGYLEQGIFGDPEIFLEKNLLQAGVKYYILNPTERFAFGFLGSETVPGYQR